MIGRRHFLLGASAAGMLLASAPARASSESWTRDAFIEAMAASGREVDISESSFLAIQKRKESALARIERYLAERFGAGHRMEILHLFRAER